MNVSCMSAKAPNVLLAFCVSCALLLAGGAVSPAAAGPADRRALLDTYCTACHNDRLRTAGLVLESGAVDAADLGAHAEVWEKVLRKVRSGQMPPAGRRRPDAGSAARFTGALAADLDALAAAAPDPGRPAVHRLNRTEYVNAVRDLLHLEIDGRALLPADDSGHGFDNNADVLTMSPALLDRYVAAATKIGRLAVGDPDVSPASATYRIPRSMRQHERMSEALPFGTRGGIAVRHMFPLDGEYRIRVRLSRDGDYGIGGLDRGDELEVRLDRRRVAAFTAGGVEELKGLTYDSQEPIPLDRPDLLERKIYDNTADEGFEVRLQVEAGLREVGAAFVRYAGVPEAGGRGSRGPSVGHVEILGPYDAAAPARHAEPGAHLRLPPADRRRGTVVRPRDPVGAGAAGVSPSGAGGRRRRAAGVLRGRPLGRRLRHGDPVRPGAAARRPGVPVPRGARSRGDDCRRGVRPERRRAGGRACRSSCGAAFRTTSCWPRPSGAT